MSVLLLLACTSVEPGLPVVGGSDTDAPVGAVGAGPDPSAFLFGHEEVIQVELTLSESAISSLRADPFSYVEGDLSVDGEEVDDVGVRIKGRLGSARGIDGKAAFRIDFDRYVEGREAWGLSGMTLNSMVNDYAQLHEITAYDFYRSIGIPAPRVGYAWLKINGVDYGLYANIETPDQNFLARSFENPDGNLYEADYLLNSDGSYVLVDFTPSQSYLFELDEGEDVGAADIQGVVDAVSASWGTDTFGATVGEVVDMQELLRFWATEMWVGQWDGYGYNSNNYRVYFDPTDGRARLLPWGHDWSFMDWRDWTAPLGVLESGCLRDPACKADFLVALEEVSAQADAWPFRERIDETTELINPYVQADPRKEVGYETALAYQESMRAWVDGRSLQLGAIWGIVDPYVQVGEVREGEVGLFDGPEDLSSGEVVVAWDLGGQWGTLDVGGIPFEARVQDLTYYAQVPDFDGDSAVWTGLEAVAYSCAYTTPGLTLNLSAPVQAGQEYTLQLLFFEPYYSGPGGRKVDIVVEGDTKVVLLDPHAASRTAGVLYTLRLTAPDDSLDVQVGAGSGGDGYAILNGLLLTR